MKNRTNRFKKVPVTKSRAFNFSYLPKKINDSFDFNSLLNTVTGITGGATSDVNNAYNQLQQSLAPLTPFADTMKSILKSTGVSVPDNLADVAKLFQQKIVAPTGQGNGNLTDTILAYVKANVDAKNNGQPVTPQGNAMANAGISFLSMSNPIFWVVLAMVGLALFFAFKK